jgi:hypothetical protein
VDKQFEPLATGEVLSVDESVQLLIGHRTFRVSELAEAIKAQLEHGLQGGWTQAKEGWFSEEGIPCEVLRFTAQGWQKGKVRINLEFCPIDSEEEHQGSTTSVENKPVVAAPPVDVSNDLDFDEQPLNTLDEDEFALGASAAFAMGDAGLDESLADTQDEFGLDESLADTQDEFGLDESLADTQDEFGLDESLADTQDEFGLETVAASDFELNPEEPTVVYAEMEYEVSTTTLHDEFDLTQMTTSLDDEFDQISESIEQELEQVEAPTASDDDLLELGDLTLDDDDDLDFGEISADSGDDLDLGDMSASDEGEFQFEEISFNSDLEDQGTDSLLDDVWQDINQPSWHNNQ